MSAELHLPVAEVSLPAGGLLPFADYLRSELRLSALTLEAYLFDVKQFLREAAAERLDPLRLQREEVERLTAASAADLSPRSHARRLSAVKSYYRFLHEEGKIDRNPAVSASGPRFESPPPYPLSVKEASALLEAAAADRSFEGLRMRAIVELLYGSGLRISEALGLLYPALRLRSASAADGHFSYVTVLGKRGKERALPLTPPAEEALRDYLACCPFAGDLGYSGYVFPGERSSASGNLTRQYVGKRLKRLAAAAGLPQEAVHPHALRHAFAGHLLQRGAPLLALKELLGHRDIASTEIYLSVLTEEHDALAALHPLALSSGPNSE